MEGLSKAKGFIKKNIVYIILAGILCTIGMTSSGFLIAGLAVFIIAIIFSSDEHRFCWSLFLVSNIRIFDSLGITFLANILMVLPLLFYLIKKINKSTQSVHLLPILGGLVLFFMASAYSIYFNEGVAPHLMWAMAFVWCAFVVIDDEVNIDKNDTIYALASGVIFSASVFVLTEPDYIRNIIAYMNTGFRFTAYANDPNYYSLYLCIALASIVIKPKIKAYDYVIMVILAIIGFLTESKMCMILMALCLIYLVIFTANDKEKKVRNIVIIVGICIIVFAMRNTIGAFFQNLFKRAGGTGATLNDLSTGRFDIVLDCLRALVYDIPLLLIGRGLNYFNHFGDYVQIGRLSHNTYLDVVMSWGVIGSGIFLSIIFYWFKLYKKRINAEFGYTRISKFPFAILLLGFFSLSCLDAGMFFFVLAVCMLQLEAKEETVKIDTMQGENDADTRN